MNPTGWATMTLGGMKEPHLYPVCASHCSCSSPISQAHTQVLTETWAAAGTGGDMSSNAHFLRPINNTMCHWSLRLCWDSRLSGLSRRHAHLPLRIHRVRSDFLSTEKWQFCAYLKGKQYVGLEKKKSSSRCKDQLTQKTKFSEFVKHTYMPQMVPASLSLQEVLANSEGKKL